MELVIGKDQWQTQTAEKRYLSEGSINQIGATTHRGHRALHPELPTAWH